MTVSGLTPVPCGYTYALNDDDTLLVRTQRRRRIFVHIIRMQKVLHLPPSNPLRSAPSLPVPKCPHSQARLGRFLELGVVRHRVDVFQGEWLG